MSLENLFKKPGMLDFKQKKVLNDLEETFCSLINEGKYELFQGLRKLSSVEASEKVIEKMKEHYGQLINSNEIGKLMKAESAFEIPIPERLIQSLSLEFVVSGRHCYSYGNEIEEYIKDVKEYPEDLVQEHYGLRARYGQLDYLLKIHELTSFSHKITEEDAQKGYEYKLFKSDSVDINEFNELVEFINIEPKFSESKIQSKFTKWHSDKWPNYYSTMIKIAQISSVEPDCFSEDNVQEVYDYLARFGNFSVLIDVYEHTRVMRAIVTF